nr:PREDICTED: uncharacterized protein LOC108217176 [Daucus carota subsp. sativus]
MEEGPSRSRKNTDLKTTDTRIILSPVIQSQRTLEPRCLFEDDEDDLQMVDVLPAHSEPVGTYRKRAAKMMVTTPQGKRVLTSDARLHLEKIKAQKKAQQQLIPLTIEEEVRSLDNRRRLLEAKLRQKQEIDRLEAALGIRKEIEPSAEYQTEDHDPSWRPSANSKQSYREDSEGSYSSRRHKRRSTHENREDEDSETSDAKSQKSSDMDRFREEFALMKEQLKSQPRGFDFPSGNPLSIDIENAKIDRNIKIPSVELFDGSTDPSDFLNMFDGRMSFCGHSEVARCRFFGTCLKGTALTWYNNLPPRSIDSWITMKNKFRARFSINKRGGKITASLMTVRQRSSEPIRDFLDRFRTEMANIPNLVEELAVNYLAAGIDKTRHGQLLEEFFEKSPRTIEAAMDIFERRLTLQEAVGSIQITSPRSKRWDKNSSPKGQWSRGLGQEKGKTEAGKQTDIQKRSAVQEPHQSNRPWPPRPPREERQFSKLNMDIATILAIMKADPNYKPPRPMNPNRPPSSKYCDYHEDTGHLTEKCFQLKHAIENKIQSGEFSHLVQREDPTSEGNKSSDRLIDVISGGYIPKGLPDQNNMVFQVETKRQRKGPSLVISFSDNDYTDGIERSHHDALVITVKMGTNTVKKVLIDNGSSVDVLFHGAFSRMDVGDRKLGDARHSPLYGFTGNEVKVLGIIDLPVLFGSPPQQVWHIVKSHVVSASCSYNAILGRTTLSALKAITSIPHLKMKFPTEFGVGEVKGDQKASKQCYDNNITPRYRTTKSASETVNQIRDEPMEEEIKIEEKEAVDVPRESVCQPIGPTEQFELDPSNPGKLITIGSGLDPLVKEELITLIREYADIFAWSPKDMPGIPEAIALHKLNISPTYKPVRQKKRIFSPEKQSAIDAELDRLLEAGFIKEVQFPTWIANTVLVKKSNGKWRMCTDYSDLNRAFPKDFYPLPNIDQLIDATSGHELLSFMDAFSGYNQIKMAPEDQNSTAFITHRGIFAYKVVPFGLLNAGATFQRTMDTIFASQVGRNMQIYVDDMIVKSLKANEHSKDLRETFTRIREHSMRLNPTKCSFGLAGGKFLGFLLTQRGIEADPAQISAIKEMPAPKTIKELQTLTGCVAALRRFIPQSSKRMRQ